MTGHDITEARLCEVLRCQASAAKQYEQSPYGLQYCFASAFYIYDPVFSIFIFHFPIHMLFSRKEEEQARYLIYDLTARPLESDKQE